MKPLAAITGDLHLRKGDRTWIRRPEIAGDTVHQMECVVQYCHDHKIPELWLLGDILEGMLATPDVLLILRRIFDACEGYGIRVRYIQGNHDKNNPTYVEATHHWPIYVHDVLFKAGQFNVYGLDYVRPTEVEHALRSVPRDAQILITHQVWKDVLGDAYGHAWIDWIPQTVRLIVSGDIHKAEVHTLGVPAAGRTFAMPGALSMQDLSESGPKSFLVLNDNLSLTSIQLISRGFYELKLNTADDVEQFVRTGWQDYPARKPKTELPPHMATNILRIWYPMEVLDARERLEACCGDQVHLFLEPMRTQETEAELLEETARQDAVLQRGLIGCIESLYGEDKRVVEDARRMLLASGSPAQLQETCMQILAEFLENGGTT